MVTLIFNPVPVNSPDSFTTLTPTTPHPLHTPPHIHHSTPLHTPMHSTTHFPPQYPPPSPMHFHPHSSTFSNSSSFLTTNHPLPISSQPTPTVSLLIPFLFPT
ncbi:hypothetical protein Pmani_032233 [Petrolisthes manimaculis]|uniref:Uncharacterized protein n=1 Tax=Petrolisthes manimaculis TaxID=1843537 RepID=A0AAE1TTZ5_9EUCA|nr:hypothetical protein Pmani_032233 [Petrolisthes manimaculis]